MTEQNPNSRIEPENEALLERVTLIFSRASEQREISNMVRRKINETPFRSMTPAKKSMGMAARKNRFAYAFAAAMSVVAITTITYFASKDISSPEAGFNPTQSQALNRTIDYKQFKSGSNAYIENGNLLVYQF